MPKVRIKLNSTDIEMLNEICNSIKEISKAAGIAISGPVPLPTKKIKVTTRKSPCGDNLQPIFAVPLFVLLSPSTSLGINSGKQNKGDILFYTLNFRTRTYGLRLQ